jgi:hypothetical protein
MKASQTIYKILLVLIIFHSCNETIELDRNNLDEHPELKTFLYEIVYIEGEFDLDTNEWDVVFKSSLPPDKYYSMLKDKPLKDGWELIYKNRNTLIFKKEINPYGEHYELSIIEIKYHPKLEQFTLRNR